MSLTETTATLSNDKTRALANGDGDIPLGPWSISGFKWFSSATDSQMSVMLAQTKEGLSAFMAPMRKHDHSATTLTGQPKTNGSTLNGVRIQRLKNKFGTQSLPTAELVLDDMRGWLVGEEGRGIQEISTILTLTRVHSAIAAVGGVGRGLGIARSYARVREVGAGNRKRMRLVDSPLHMRTLATMTAEYHRLMLLSVYSAYILGKSEHPKTAASRAMEALTPSRAELTTPLLRVLSQLAKAYVCKPSVSILFSCMESLGGVGYLVNEEQEHLNISRIYRDTCVLPIWEGTTDVLCTDFVRALKHPHGGAASMAALDDVITRASKLNGQRPSAWDPIRQWNTVKERIESTSQADLMGVAREVVWAVGDVLVALLLYVDAARDDSAIVYEMLLRFLEEKGQVAKRARMSTADELTRDVAIVYGEETTTANAKL